MEAKLNKVRRTTVRKTVFYPQTMGVFVLIVIILAISVGAVRRELALALTGAAFFLPWMYCLAMTLLLALLHRRRARRACIRLSPREVTAGESVEAIYNEGDAIGTMSLPAGKILQLPGILVRCRLLLLTKDGRRIQHDFNPALGAPHFFEAQKRGAFFSTYNELAIFDILGLFRFAYRISAAVAENDTSLLVSPLSADETLAVNARAGDSKLKPEFSFQRTDNLVDNRPYVPGDDPRRINWKLFGHGSGLFVREGEREPPPHSNMLILVDTEYDPLLFDVPNARRGVDVLCENALAAALACIESGMNVQLGHSGSAQFADTRSAKELATALAWPAAIPLSADTNFPAVPDNYGILVLALPRSSAETSALDRLLKEITNRSGKNTARITDVVFISGSTEQYAAAEVCVTIYNRRQGVRARIAGSRE